MEIEVEKANSNTVRFLNQRFGNKKSKNRTRIYTEGADVKADKKMHAFLIRDLNQLTLSARFAAWRSQEF